MPNNFNFQWKIGNAKNAAKTGEIYIYSVISDYQYDPEGITATSFKNELEALGDIKQLNVYINSPGGSPFVAVAIMNIVDRCKKKNNFTVTTFNDGLAASAASLLLMMGDKIVIPSNAITMIHRAWTIAIGNANDFRKMVKELDTIDESLVSVYQTKNKALSKEEIMELLDNETWMSAQDAVDYGFDVEIGEEKQVAACIKDNKLFTGETGFDIKSFGFKSFPADKFTKIADGVAPSDVSNKKAPENETWSAPTLSDFTDKSWGDLTDGEKKNIAGHFAWATEIPPITYGDLKLPHHNKSGEIVWNGVANAAARLGQTDIPSEDVSKVQAHLGAHYRAFNKVPPWEQDDQSKAENFIVSVVMEALKTNKGQLRETLKNLLESKPEENPTPKSGIFDIQKHADKISQLVERRKKHE